MSNEIKNVAVDWKPINPTGILMDFLAALFSKPTDDNSLIIAEQGGTLSIFEGRDDNPEKYSRYPKISVASVDPGMIPIGMLSSNLPFVDYENPTRMEIVHLKTDSIQITVIDNNSVKVAKLRDYILANIHAAINTGDFGARGLAIVNFYAIRTESPQPWKPGTYMTRMVVPVQYELRVVLEKDLDTSDQILQESELSIPVVEFK